MFLFNDYRSRTINKISNILPNVINKIGEKQTIELILLELCEIYNNDTHHQLDDLLKIFNKYYKINMANDNLLKCSEYDQNKRLCLSTEQVYNFHKKLREIL